ncbi:hypothetical protein BDN70DRAFT_887273 [Pholiota conissans]|uniref:Uncharacterized protein n=1 Tax=Pholiota conissans TaxID=109636 RepID=A0A9P5YMT5_9AGAR|nr:hypothetical protein BDN70DRAFT_887273 [Pholiota conissans]
MIEPLSALALGYIAGRLLGSSDSDDYVKFAQPFLVRVQSPTAGLEKNEYITVIAYVSNTERKELAGMQRGGAIEFEFKAKYVEDVGDIGDGPDDWAYIILGG